MTATRSLGRLLLGSTAVLTAAAGAQAADLPSRKAAPVEYVKICDAYGSGFFFIPGTDTCLKIGGYVRVEAQYTPGQNIIAAGNTAAASVLAGTGSTVGAVPAGSVGGGVTQIANAQDQTGLEVRGRVDLDARTQTSYGTVRTFIRLRATNSDGTRSESQASNFQTAYVPVGNGASKLTMERSYIQFAGITAGLMDENFNTAPGPAYFFTSNFTSGFSNGVKGLRYDAIFGGGFTWENSIESRGDFDFGGTDTAKGSTLAPSTVQTSPLNTYNNHWDTGYNLVSTITYTQAWGHVALSGAVGNNSVGHGAPGVGGVATLTDSYNALSGPVKYGSWAVGPEIDILLPMITPGDEFYANFAYSHGLLGEVSGTGFSELTGGSPNKRVLGGVIREDSDLTPTVVDANGNVVAYGEDTGWEFNASFTHYWTPQWRSNVGFSYLVITPPTAFATGIGGTGACAAVQCGLNTQWGKGTLYAVQGNIIWSPTKNFDIGIEAEWGHANNVLQNPSVAFINAGSPGLSESNWTTKLRLQRGF